LTAGDGSASLFFMDLRNVAILAHVDHGKTTLVDAFLKQTGVFRPGEQVQECVLDSNPLERERGITILAKNTAIFHGRTKINIVDTPGHADFGGEVQRIMSMVDGALLIVDAAEGPLPQTRYVLQKALEQRLRIIVVLNKIDRPDARPAEVIDAILDLFIALGADDNQLDFPLLYASARAGLAHEDLDTALAALAARDYSFGITPLLDTIVRELPPPGGDTAKPLQFLVTNLDYDDYVGRIAIGRVHNGILRTGETVAVGRPDEQLRPIKLGNLYVFERLRRVAVNAAPAGEIAAITGISDINIGDTLTDIENPKPMPPLVVDEPTLTVMFRINDCPLAGQEGSLVTSRQLRERLWRESRTNVALRVEETDNPDTFKVSGRGELHLGILMETMRREGYEFTVSKPHVVCKTIDGVLHEPLENVSIEVPPEYTGTVMEQLGERRGELVNMKQLADNTVRMEFIAPTRGLVGFASQLLTETKGYGVMHVTFHGWGPHRGPIPGRQNGSMVAWEAGKATAYALENLQERGELFIKPGTDVYEGMIIGAASRRQDLDVNCCKKRHATNMRASTAEIDVKLDPPRRFTLEQALAYIADDEMLEVTPLSLRMRKAILSRHERAKQATSGAP